MSKIIGSFEAKTKLSEYLRYVQGSRNEVIITNRGKQIAKISPLGDAMRTEGLKKDILEFRNGRKLKGNLKKLISQGRK